MLFCGFKVKSRWKVQLLGLLMRRSVCFGLQALSASPPTPLRALSHGHHRGCVNGLLDLQPVHTGTACLLPAAHQKASLRLLFAQLVAPCLRVTKRVCAALWVCVLVYQCCDEKKNKTKKEQEPLTGQTQKFSVKLLLCYSYLGFCFVLFFYLH